LSFATQARAEWRVLLSAALIGSGFGLAVGATYLAGGMAQAATDYSRAERIAQAAAGGFSESALQREAAGMTPGALRQARSHDPLVSQAADPTPFEDGRRNRTVAATGRFGSALNRTRELDCLTQAVYFEARGETPRGQAAVAQVVLNRVKHPAFPKTVCAVVFQGAAHHRGCQFSFACDGSMRRGLEHGAWERARKVASRALSGVALADVGSATHFHTTAVSPGWGPRMLRVSQVGLHVFYRFNPHARSLGPAPEQAVFVNLPAQAMAPTAPLRLATAMVEKTIGGALATPAPPSQPVQVQAVQATKPPASEIPAADVGKAADASASLRGSGEPAV